MLTTEDLRAIEQILDIKLEPIKQKLEIIEEKASDINTAIDEITDWIEKASDINRIPFMQAK